MTPTERLWERLESLGYTVERIDVPRGYWTHVTQDVTRWEARVHHPDKPRITTIVSWDTVTACARRGFEIQEKGKGTMSGYPEAHAHPPKNRRTET